MRQLSGLDAQFLHVESRTTVGHVGGLILLDPAAVHGGALTLDDVRDVLEPRLHLAEPLRQRLVTVPFGLGLPYWFDDPDFDIEFHLREVALPGPGDDRQLGEQVARIHARPLDRTRPLWELYLVHGIDGGRQAIYAKIHHAAIDGVSGTEILNTILDVTPEPRIVEPPDELWQPEPLPSQLELAGRGLAASAAQPLDILRTLPRALPHVADLPGASRVPGIQAVSDFADAAVRTATSGSARDGERRMLTTPPTPLNAPITAHRRFAYGSLPLVDVKKIRQAFGLSVNDVVMVLATAALRRWLLDHDGLPDEPVVVAVPVSVRGAGSGSGGNEISVMLAELATQIADPIERLEAVQLALAEARRQFNGVPATILQDISAVIPMALSGLAARAVFRMVTMGSFPFNLFVSNVPGPQLPLYVAGARVTGVYPASAITDMTGALNITLFSYDGSLDFGLIACRELVPDVWNLIGYLRDALDELLALAQAHPPGAAEPAHPVSAASAAASVVGVSSAKKTATKKAAAKRTPTKRTAAKKAAPSPTPAKRAPSQDGPAD
ncbi:MAG TPA: wax ester/triacylglycerol synthase family O-acyltransferase [Nocardioidaceae bacterium]|nr:wax ester/triacylglycerol synthase family O-acyltransferase [Nocardioidaceae bacterium]